MKNLFLTILVLLCFVSINCYAWEGIKLDFDTLKVSCQHSPYTPQEFMAGMMKPDLGFSKCSIKNDGDIVLVICKEPSGQIWAFTKSLALCMKYRDNVPEKFISTLLRYSKK